MAGSADDPDDPVSVVGLDAPTSWSTRFDVSYGDPQTVAVTAKRAIKGTLMHYRINGGRTAVALVRGVEGRRALRLRERRLLRRVRGTVRGAKPGDTVEVWFTRACSPVSVATRSPGSGSPRASTSRTRSPRTPATTVLVIANEDYTGVQPERAAERRPEVPRRAPRGARRTPAMTADVWDVDAQGVPHDLGVLSHYDAVALVPR